MIWYDALDAAQIATSQGYDDWYLPNKEELELMYSTIGNGGENIGGFDDTGIGLHGVNLDGAGVGLVLVARASLITSF